MEWEVEVTDRFADWYGQLPESDVQRIQNSVELLRRAGPALGRPHADTVRGSRYPNMKELRIQANGDPLRVFFAFDPRRVAVLLIGGDKTGTPRFYDLMIRVADELYDDHLREIAESPYG